MKNVRNDFLPADRKIATRGTEIDHISLQTLLTLQTAVYARKDALNVIGLFHSAVSALFGGSVVLGSTQFN